MKTPFGDTVAATKLAQLVDNNKKARRIVSTYFSDFLAALTALVAIKDRRTQRKLMLVVRQHYVTTVNRDITLAADIKSYLLNSMAAYWRGMMKANQGLHPTPQKG